MKKTKLSQLVAVEADVRKSAYSDLTKTHHLVQKPASVSGESATYRPKDEGGETFPPANRLVQVEVEETLREIASKQIPFWDLALSKDTANCSAFADLTLPNGSILEKVPVSTLLFMEKQLQDVITFLEKLPVLDADKIWRRDEARNLWVTDPVESAKTAKVQEALVLYPATEKHPAQTQMVTTDKVVGTWTKQYLSGAVPEKRRKQLVARAQLILQTIKKAREEANSIQVEERNGTQALWDYLLNT